ncbi:MAG: FHA domain-containing protein [Armatimonadota bacterium]
MDIALIVGKYMFLALMYLFVFLVYRAILRDVRSGTESDDARSQEATEAPAAAAEMREAGAPLATAEARVPVAGDKAGQATAWLVVVQSPDTNKLRGGATLSLSSATTLGRSSENAIVLPDRFVSARHALVYLAQGRHLLRDRDSTNGTFVNGERIHSDVVLTTGDRLEIGTTILEYRQ